MKCRVCGCSDSEPCLSAGGETCAWIEDDLCDFCEGKEVHIYSEGDLNEILLFSGPDYRSKLRVARSASLRLADRAAKLLGEAS